MGAKKSKLNKEVLDELCSKTKFRNYFRESNVQSYSHHPQPALIECHWADEDFFVPRNVLWEF